MITPTPGPLVKYYRTRCGYDTTERNEGVGEPFYRPADVERVLQQVVVMLEEYSRVLHCWMNTYAPELCDVEEVRKAQQYIFEQGGTLAFIARQRAEALTLLAILKGRTA